MLQAEQELIDLGVDAVAILATLFNGQACNESGIPYRRLGLPLQCAIEVARRLGVVAKPLEPYLLMELKNENLAAALALGSLGTLTIQSVEALSQFLDGNNDLSFDSARALIGCGEIYSMPVQQAIKSSDRAAYVIARISASCTKV